MASGDNKLLIRGGLVYDHDGDPHKPAISDILIEGADIVAVGANLPGEQTSGAEIVDASDHLVIPGLFNAHYHSHDTLCRGMFEEMPLEFWLLHTLPLSGNRSKEEVRVRTLVGALESMRCGITTVQDMVGLIPLNDEYVDVVISAYEEIGERVVFSPMVSDVPAVGMMCFEDILPDEVHEMIGTKALGTAKDQLAFLDAEIKRRPNSATTHWGVGPFAPQRASLELLEGCADLAERHDLGIYIHVYESKGQVVMAREFFGDHGGSFINYMDAAGILNRRLNIAHSVWIGRDEMDRMAEADAGAVLNHLSNMKLKSGMAPMLDMKDAGMRVALGCDNCSGSDVQNMFQAMKLLCGLAAVSDPEPGPPSARDAMRTATLGGARAVGLDGAVGAIQPGMLADISILDLGSLALVPLNSAARQLVFAGGGAAVETVIVAGRIVVQDRRLTTIDEAALRQAVDEVMPSVRADLETVNTRLAEIGPGLLDAWRRSWREDIGFDRYAGDRGK